MRLELAGSLVKPPTLLLGFAASQSFDRDHYISLGYNHFDVICIGGSGGTGGGINAGAPIRNVGGAGGGGGYHRVQGLLSALPATPAIVVGGGGALGTEHASNPALTTDGGDGGYSSFNDPTCRASGGKGGKRAQSNSATVATLANGGDGGVGNRTIAGGGALGGVSGTPTATGPGTPGTAGQDGTFFSNVGKGGGGGAGGVGSSSGTVNLAGTAGGRGSWNPGDTSVYGPGLPPVGYVAGGAGGAKASPLNGLPTVYGQSPAAVQAGAPGAVFIRLTAE